MARARGQEYEVELTISPYNILQLLCIHILYRHQSSMYIDDAALAARDLTMSFFF